MLALIFGGKEEGGKPGTPGRPPQPRKMTADRWRSMARRHNEMMRAKNRGTG